MFIALHFGPRKELDSTKKLGRTVKFQAGTSGPCIHVQVVRNFEFPMPFPRPNRCMEDCGAELAMHRK